MTQEEIQNQIQREMDEYVSQQFPGLLPEWFLEYFERAIMEMPQHVVPYRTDIPQAILNKKNIDLTLFEVDFISTVYLNVKPSVFGKKIHQFLVMKTAFESIAAKCTQLRESKRQSLFRKTQSFNEKKIIPATKMPNGGLQRK